MTEDTPSPAGRFHLAGFILKAMVSVGLIAIIARKFDIASVWEKSRHLSAAVIVSVVLMFTVQTYVAAGRWWVILRHHGVLIRLTAAIRICFIGAFFNQVLPSSIGGDVARAWYVYRSGFGKKNAAITVLSDRIYGMLTLACLAVLFYPVLIYFSIGNDALVVVGILIVGALSALLAVFWLDRLPDWMRRWTFVRHLGSLSEATRAVSLDKGVAVPLLSLSFLVHALTILAILVLLEAVAPQCNMLLCAALVPVIMLMAMVPISIAGWGVRESVMIYGLGLAKVPREAALVVSIMVGLSLVAVGLMGGWAWLTEASRKKGTEVIN
jgi:glycosyltransferase 2 family protein